MSLLKIFKNSYTTYNITIYLDFKGTDIRGAMLIKHQEWEWGGVTVTTPTNKIEADGGNWMSTRRKSGTI